MAEAAQDEQHQPSERMSTQEMAAQMFGPKYHGEVPEKPETPEPEDPALPAEDETQSAAVEGEEVEPEVQPEEPEAAEEYVASVGEFIEAQGLDPEWMYTLTDTLKVDGELREMTLADIKAEAQKNLAGDNRFEHAKALQAELAQQKQQWAESFDLQATVAANLLKESGGEIAAAKQQLESSGLRDNDPAEYAAQLLKLQEREQGWKTKVMSLADSVRQENERRAQTNAQQMQEQLAKGSEALLEAIPEWRNPEVAKKDATALQDYLIQQGFTEQQLRENTDSRLFVMAHKARLYDESKGAADVTQKRLRRVPKVAKPGAPKAPEQINQEKVSAARQKVRSSKSLQDQIAAAAEAKRLSRRN